MCGHGLNVQSDGSGLTPESLRSDTELVDLVQHFHFQIRIVRVLIGGINGPHQCFFRKKGSLVKSTSDAHTHNHRRTWVRACCLDCLQDEILDSLQAC